jgi:hypothetical protein
VQLQKSNLQENKESQKTRMNQMNANRSLPKLILLQRRHYPQLYELFHLALLFFQEYNRPHGRSFETFKHNNWINRYLLSYGDSIKQVVQWQDEIKASKMNTIFPYRLKNVSK